MVARVVSVANVVEDDRCPGVLHAVAALDGALVRVRVPGGLISPSQLAAIADAAQAYGDGYVDVTARAGIQLRGVRDAALGELAVTLAAAALLPSAAHDRVRNIVTSPFAGVDPDEVLDPRPLVRALDAALIRDASLAALPAKFGFAIDGGGRPVHVGRADVVLRAVATPDGPVWETTSPGHPELRQAQDDTAAIGLLMQAAQRALAQPMLAQATAPPTQPARAHHAVPQAPPLGVISAHRPDLVNVVPSVPLGRLTATQTRAVAALAARCGADLRLAPWRGIVLAAIPRATLAHVASELARHGLPLDGTDGFAGIAACAGTGACPASLADVRGDATRLAHRLAGSPIPAAWNVTIAGCSKRCAMRRDASVALIATDAGYDVLVAGKRARAAAHPDDALRITAAVHRAHLEDSAR